MPNIRAPHFHFNITIILRTTYYSVPLQPVTADHPHASKLFSSRPEILPAADQNKSSRKSIYLSIANVQDCQRHPCCVFFFLKNQFIFRVDRPEVQTGRGTK